MVYNSAFQGMARCQALALISRTLALRAAPRKEKEEEINE